MNKFYQSWFITETHRKYAKSKSYANRTLKTDRCCWWQFVGFVERVNWLAMSFSFIKGNAHRIPAYRCTAHNTSISSTSSNLLWIHAKLTYTKLTKYITKYTKLDGKLLMCMPPSFLQSVFVSVVYAMAYPHICLSVTLRYCVKTRKRRGMLSSPMGSPVSPSFPIPRMVDGRRLSK